LLLFFSSLKQFNFLSCGDKKRENKQQTNKQRKKINLAITELFVFQ